MVELARHGKVRAAVVLPAGFGAEAPRALMLGGASRWSRCTTTRRRRRR
jgi:hypothetical protein